MLDCRIVFNTTDGKRIWINPLHIIKMTRTHDKRFFVLMVNGEEFEISHDSAKDFEKFLEDD